MTKNDYKKVAVQWREYELPLVKPRDVDVDFSSDLVWALIGPRRAGKTFACFQTMNDLLKKGIPRNNLLYINFEDEKLVNARAADAQGIVDAFYELFPPSRKHPVFLFLDEIQNVTHWQKWVRRIHDSDNKTKIVITGSSAKLLSKELATELRGRVLTREIFPLSFQEYVLWQGVSYNPRTMTQSKSAITLRRHFDIFLHNGGYPAIMLNPPSLREQIAQQYFDAMLLNDIVERYAIRDVRKLRILAGFLFESVGKEMSFSRLANKCEAAGHALSKNTIIEYVNYFEDAYVFFQNIRYEYSLSKQLGSLKKVFCIDNGLANAVSFKFSNDTGRLLENIVYLELKRRGERVYYHHDHGECDFVIHKKNRIDAAIQVTAELTEENERREVEGLREAMEKFKLKKGYLLTCDQSDQRTMNKRTIIIMPVWEWLLQKTKNGG